MRDKGLKLYTIWGYHTDLMLNVCIMSDKVIYLLHKTPVFSMHRCEDVHGRYEKELAL
jgi:hypothetical protein